VLLRIDKPIGSYLLFWPGAWSIALASAPADYAASSTTAFESPVLDTFSSHALVLPDFRLLALFGVGAVIMRGAGCIVNDLWDRNLDKYGYGRRNYCSCVVFRL
jgi:4-hydroxybenzoate polyprenyltransferase